MPRGAPNVRRGRAHCSICGAAGVKAPTCTGNRESHALMASAKVERPMGASTPYVAGQYERSEPQWTSRDGWPLWETLTVVEEVTTEPPNGWFNVGPVTAAEPVDVEDDISTLERIAIALESIAKALK
jgi:hypothetical protein